MTTTYKGAKDDIFKLVTTANKNQTVVGYEPEIRYQGKELATEPASDKLWMRLSKNTIVSEQKTLSTCVSAPGKKMYIEAGLVVLQLFIPKNNGDYAKAELWAEVLRNAFRGVKTANGVWFRNAVIKELDPEVGFLRINVIAEFNYSEIY